MTPATIFGKFGLSTTRRPNDALQRLREDHWRARRGLPWLGLAAAAIVALTVGVTWRRARTQPAGSPELSPITQTQPTASLFLLLGTDGLDSERPCMVVQELKTFQVVRRGIGDSVGPYRIAAIGPDTVQCRDEAGSVREWTRQTLQQAFLVRMKKASYAARVNIAATEYA